MKINYINQIGQTNQQPKFKSKIIVVKNKTFFNILEANKKRSFEVGRTFHSDFLIEEAAVRHPLPYTFCAYNCVVGTIINRETKLANMFHLSPYEKTIKNIENVARLIYEHAKTLKEQSFAALEGLVLAGNGHKEECGNDKILMASVLDAFSKISNDMGMTYSVITGRKDGFYGVSAITDAQNGINYIYPFSEGSQKPVKKGDITGFYEKVIISPNDTLKRGYINKKEKLVSC